MLTPEPLTAAAFAPFGDVLDRSAVAGGERINAGHALKAADLTRVVAGDGHAAVHLYRSQPPAPGFRLEEMERHPLGSQLFMPLDGQRFLVVVAPAGDLDPAAIRAFVTAPGQGVNLHAGTWHHWNLVLDGPGDFLVVDRAGPGENCDVLRLSPALDIHLPN